MAPRSSACCRCCSVVLLTLLDVEPSYLQAGLDQVRASYGSMQNYATEGLGLSPRTLRALRTKLLVGQAR
ncbi:tyrosine-protein phosphatase [Candidatus Frankia nodulisporulans]|uniref:tyrosine-protein phosphatase n=1 Tax=Candidatus Frankia nodulisporulans TaxID=2060052 RepID=UPI0013D853E3|nr:tyrosine-protein phosphatase [Candidatus Frankia nodulisporulans]